MAECILLSDDELNALLGQGAILVAGPFDDDPSCEAACGSSSSSGSSGSSSGSGSSGSESSGSGSSASGSGSQSEGPPSCPFCNNGLPPLTFSIASSGWTDGPNCPQTGSCTTLNGTFTLARIASTCPENIWRSDPIDPSTICPAVGNSFWSINAVDNGSGITWTLDFAGEFQWTTNTTYQCEMPLVFSGVNIQDFCGVPDTIVATPA